MANMFKLGGNNWKEMIGQILDLVGNPKVHINKALVGSDDIHVTLSDVDVSLKQITLTVVASVKTSLKIGSEEIDFDVATFNKKVPLGNIHLPRIAKIEDIQLDPIALGIMDDSGESGSPRLVGKLKIGSVEVKTEALFFKSVIAHGIKAKQGKAKQLSANSPNQGTQVPVKLNADGGMTVTVSELQLGPSLKFESNKPIVIQIPKLTSGIDEWDWKVEQKCSEVDMTTSIDLSINAGVGSIDIQANVNGSTDKILISGK